MSSCVVLAHCVFTETHHLPREKTQEIISKQMTEEVRLGLCTEDDLMIASMLVITPK